MEFWPGYGSSVEDLTGSQLHCSVNGQSRSSLSVSSSDPIIFSSQQPFEYSHSEPYVPLAIDFDAFGQVFSGQGFDAAFQTMNLTFDDMSTNIFLSMTGHDPDAWVRNTPVSGVAPGLGHFQDGSWYNFENPFTQRYFKHEDCEEPFTSFVSPKMDIVPPSPSFPTHTESRRPMSFPRRFGCDEDVLVQNANHPSPEVQNSNAWPSCNGEHHMPLIPNQPMLSCMVDVAGNVSFGQTVSPQGIQGDDGIRVLAQHVQNMHMELRPQQSDDGETKFGGQASNYNKRNPANRGDRRQRRPRCPFSPEETQILIDAVRMLGRRWAEIKRRYFTKSDRTREDLKDKWRSLRKTATIDPRKRRGDHLSQELLDDFCDVG